MWSLIFWFRVEPQPLQQYMYDRRWKWFILAQQITPTGWWSISYLTLEQEVTTPTGGSAGRLARTPDIADKWSRTNLIQTLTWITNAQREHAAAAGNYFFIYFSSSDKNFHFHTCTYSRARLCVNESSRQICDAAPRLHLCSFFLFYTNLLQQ